MRLLIDQLMSYVNGDGVLNWSLLTLAGSAWQGGLEGGVWVVSGKSRLGRACPLGGRRSIGKAGAAVGRYQGRYPIRPAGAPARQRDTASQPTSPAQSSPPVPSCLASVSNHCFPVSSTCLRRELSRPP